MHISNDDLLNIACRTAGRNLTPQEWQEAFGDQPYHKTCPNLPTKETQSSGVSTGNSFPGFIWQKFREAIATLGR